jgi:hypothetical protein
LKRLPAFPPERFRLCLILALASLYFVACWNQKGGLAFPSRIFVTRAARAGALRASGDEIRRGN